MADLPVLMGVVNVTPDSFSDGGLYANADAAIAQGLKLIEEGAQIIDIGGESTRPGAAPVSVEEELKRVLPVLDGLRDKGVLLSIDTRNAATMREALKHGAGMINDVTALKGDPDSMAVAIGANVPVCLMHMQGDPRTMQNAPVYGDVVQDVFSELLHQGGMCIQAGMKREHVILDPGIGFGKTLEHNLELLRNLETFTVSGFPILLGTSRKSFIAKVMGEDVDPQDRLGGSIATALRGVEAGVNILRVHDVAATRQAIQVWRAVRLI